MHAKKSTNRRDMNPFSNREKEKKRLLGRDAAHLAILSVIPALKLETG